MGVCSKEAKLSWSPDETNESGTTGSEETMRYRLATRPDGLQRKRVGSNQRSRDGGEAEKDGWVE